MARIPTYTAEGGLPAGGTGPQASPAAYAAPARALGGLGETIAQTGMQIGRAGMAFAERKERIKDLERQRTEQEGSFWAAGKSEELQQSIIEFVSKNRNAENLDEMYQQFAQQRSNEMMAEAPSDDASKKFRLSADRTFNNYYDNVLRQSTSNKISKFETGLREGSVNIVDIMMMDGVSSGEEFFNARIEGINGLSFLSEESKQKYRAALTRDVAIGIATKHSWYSKQLIDRSKDIDPKAKRDIYNYLNEINQANTKAEFNSYQTAVADILGEAFTGNIKVQMPPSEHLRAYFNDEASFNHFKQSTQDKFTAHNARIDLFKDRMYLNPAAAERAVMQDFKKLPGRIQTALREPVRMQLDAMQKMAEQDPAMYVMQSNPKVLSENKIISDLEKSYNDALSRNDDETAQILGVEVQARKRDLLKTLWSLQGSYEELAETVRAQGADFGIIRSTYAPDEFQNLPQSQRRLLTKQQAESYFGLLTKGGWNERYQAFKQIQSSMGDERMFMVAVKDIEQMNPGNSHLIQQMLVAAELDKAKRPDLVNTVLNPSDDVKQFLNPKNQTFEQLKKELNNLPAWNQFKKATRGAGPEDSDLVSGFEDAILKVAANSLVSPVGGIKGMSEAVKKAFESTVELSESTIDVPSVAVARASGSTSSYPIRIAKDRLNGQTGKIDPSLRQRNPDDMRRIAANLAYSVGNLDPDDIALYDKNQRPIFEKSIPSAYMFGKETLEQESANLMMRQLVSNSFWRTDIDGQGATLMLVGENQQLFAPTRKNGQYIRIRFSDLEGVDLSRRMLAPGEYEGIGTTGP